MRKQGLSLSSRFSFITFLLFFLCLIPHPLSLVSPSFAEIKKDNKITINFVDVELPALTKFISEVTGKNFIFDERLKGKITVIAPSKLKPEDTYNLFISILRLKDFAVIPTGANTYKIVPSREAKAQGLEVFTERPPINENYSIRLVPVKYTSPSDALRVFRPLISPDGYMEVIGDFLLVVDSGLNIEKILSILDNIDKPVTVEDFETVYLKYSSADAITKTINDSLAQKGRAIPGQATLALRAVADQRLNAVILFGGKEIRDSIKRLIAHLDVAPKEVQGRVNVYFLENADATEMGKVLEGMLKGTQPGAARQTTVGTGVPQAPLFESGVTITPDKATNSLIIVASPSDYQNLVQIIKQLDKRRRQVFVEAMIVEASINKLRDIGIKWRAIKKINNEPVLIGGFGAVTSDTLNTIVSGMSGIGVGGMANFMNIDVTQSDGTIKTMSVPGLAALFSLDEFSGAVNVLSTPQILTSDNKDAEIVVGENVPFITRRESGPSGTLSVFSSVERQDVGIKLTIKPQITEGDYVNLDVYQEISSVQTASDNVLISVGPSTTKRSTKTAITVKDGRTVVIGGLISEREEERNEKIPFLGDLPVIGWLFKNENKTRTKTNLLVFITPHIVKEAEAMDRITKDKEKEFAVASSRYAEGELLVKFKDGVSDEKARSIIIRQGATLIKFIEEIKVYHIKLGKGQDVDNAVKEFLTIPEVQYAEPNYIFKVKNTKSLR